jgi:hypothetical protein
LEFPTIIRRGALMMVENGGGLTGPPVQDQHSPPRERRVQTLRPLARPVIDFDPTRYSFHVSSIAPL